MESSSDYVTGGTLTSTVDRWSSRVSKKDSDPSGMGRWSYQTLVGKRNSKITIITGYRCVHNTSGDSSAWTLQSIFMKDRQSKTAPNPRKQFIMDLIAFINQQRSLNHEIILNLDANEALGEESQGIAKLMRECNLVDLHDIPEMEWNSNSKTPTNKETSDRLISCLAHHGYKHAYNDEEHWSTMMVSCQTIVGCMSIWMQCHYLEVLLMIK